MQSSRTLKLTFCGGTGSVTGANFLLESDTQKFVIDCGLTQSTKLADEANWEPFLFDATTIDILFITHAHIDHIGRIPKLINDGFKGRIISTIETKDLIEPMLRDTIGILSRDHEHGLDKIYTEENLKKALSLWEGIAYHEELNIEGGFRVSFKDAGHILGSGMLHIVYNQKVIVFTGDLGNSPAPLLRDTEALVNVDYLVMESVYGDRNHEDRSERKKKFEGFIEDNYKRGGVLMIPTFSLDRTQEMLFELNDLVENKRIPEMPIYLDSPLAIKLTAVYKKHMNVFNETAQKALSHDDIFTFPGLKITLATEESKEILRAPNPKIVIAGSGMSNGGRIIHHELNYLPDPKNTLLLMGYQSLGTLGRKIEDGAKSIHIMGEDVQVRAQVAKISGYSGHKDSDGLVNFVETIASSVKKIFVVMGEPKSSLFLVQRIRDNLALDAVAPMQGESVVLDF